MISGSCIGETFRHYGQSLLDPGPYVIPIHSMLWEYQIVITRFNILHQRHHGRSFLFIIPSHRVCTFHITHADDIECIQETHLLLEDWGGIFDKANIWYALVGLYGGEYDGFLVHCVGVHIE
jgi:hypothetical protein